MSNLLDVDADLGILATIGHTPLICLRHVLGDIPFQLYAKLEMFNPGGSAKDRPALSIIKNALEQGMIQSDSTVIESSSGNMGIGLAQACAYFKLKFLCVVDPKTTTQNIAMLKAYGAHVDLVTEPSRETGEFLHARLNRVQFLLQTIPNSFWANQYANEDNPRAYYQTMHEIMERLEGKIDYLFCATSTCGTLRGCAEYVHEQNLAIQITAVDAQGSAIFKSTNGPRLIPGHGAGIRPPLYLPDLAHNIMFVSDKESVIGCRRLLQREAILAGGSSGAIIMALERAKHDIAPNAVCVAILCDRGERYLDTIYSDAWVAEHLGDIAYLYSK